MLTEKFSHFYNFTRFNKLTTCVVVDGSWYGIKEVDAVVVVVDVYKIEYLN